MNAELKKILYRGAWRKHFNADASSIFINWGKANSCSPYSKRLEQALLGDDPEEQIKGLQYRLHNPIFKGMPDKYDLKQSGDLTVFGVDRFIRNMSSPLLVADINGLFCSNAVQISISRVLKRLVIKVPSFQEFFADAYQESYVQFVKLAVKFFDTYDPHEEFISYDFMSYIERYLFSRLKHWHLVENLQFKYDRESAKAGKRKYRSIISELYSKLDRVQVEEAPTYKHAAEIAMLSVAEMVGIVRQRSKREAECLELKYLQERKVQEISSCLGIQEGTVRGYLSDAYKRLRDWSKRREIS